MSPVGLDSVLIDVSQYASWPASTGVQRVLLHVVADWSSEQLPARFGFIDGNRYVTGPIGGFSSVIAARFRDGARTVGPEHTAAAIVQQALHDASDERFPIAELENRYSAFLLPEPTLHDGSLRVAEALMGSPTTRSFFIYFDSLPLTHPQFFPHGAGSSGAVSRYNRVVASGESVAFISRHSRDVFESRVARRSLSNATVLRLGADGFEATAGVVRRPPTFVVVGTVEPRKRHRLVLDAFEQLWSQGRNYRLTFLGAEGWETPELFERIRRLVATKRLEWNPHADDGEVRTALANAAGLIFTPVAEGYGLPLVEALALGCPVIVGPDVPALEGLASDGQLRLDEVSPEAVAAAVEALADSKTNAGLRDAASMLRLPTWHDFSRDLEVWVANTLDHDTEFLDKR